MNKYIKNLFLYMIISIILMTTCVIAYTTNNLISYHNFDLNDINNIADLKEYDNNLTKVGIINATFTNGISGNALNYANIQVYYTNFTPTGINTLMSTGQFSINFWAKNPGTTQVYFYLGNNKNFTLANYYYLFSGSPTYNIMVKLSPYGGESDAGIPKTETTYTMITLVYQNMTSIKMYKNSVLAHTITYGTLEWFAIENMNYLGIGQPSTHNTTIDELSTWNILLTQDDINKLYTATNYDAVIGNATNPLNYTVIEYACTNTNFTAIGNNNLCIGDFVLSSNGIGVCGQIFGINTTQTCINGCTYYGIDIGGYCNANTTLNINQTYTIGNANLSANQCVVSLNQDYLCNNTIIDNNTYDVYCDLSYLTKCPKYCITYVANQNDSTIDYFNAQQMCSVINLEKLSGMELLCTVNWLNTNSWVYNVLTQNIISTMCTTIGYVKIPLTKCDDASHTINEYLMQHLQDNLYIEGQCSNEPTKSSCTIGEPSSCANIMQTKSCIQYPDGSFKYNVTDCESGKTCNSGLCTVAENERDTETANTKATHTNIAIIITALALIGGIVLGVFAFKGQQNAGLIGVAIGLILMLLSLIGFAIYGWLPVIVVFLLVIADACIIVVTLNRIFMSGG